MPLTIQGILPAVLTPFTAEGEVDTVKPGVERLMMEVAKLSVPLVVDAGVGANWEEAH